MIYSRRNFLKAAGSGVAITFLGGESVLLSAAAPALATAMSTEKATFLINGKPHAVEYEARTTLWEVIAVQLGLVGTNRSCNRASCGACRPGMCVTTRSASVLEPRSSWPTWPPGSGADRR